MSVPIYMHIRLCISMHLFLLGYENFSYSWQKGRTGIVRLTQVRIEGHKFVRHFIFMICPRCYSR